MNSNKVFGLPAFPVGLAIMLIAGAVSFFGVEYPFPFGKDGPEKENRIAKLEELKNRLIASATAIEKVRRANVASEPAGFNLYPESVPCCGGDENVVAEETVDSIPDDASIEEARRQMIEQMPEETQQMVNDMIHELEEFKATFSEDQLAQLEERKSELRRQQKAQMVNMIAALPEKQRQEAQRQLTMMERAMEKPIEMQALIDQLLEIRQQQKMNQTLEMLEDAARQ